MKESEYFNNSDPISDPDPDTHSVWTEISIGLDFEVSSEGEGRGMAYIDQLTSRPLYALRGHECPSTHTLMIFQSYAKT